MSSHPTPAEIRQPEQNLAVVRVPDDCADDRLAKLAEALDAFAQGPTPLQQGTLEMIINKNAMELSFRPEFTAFPDNPKCWGCIQFGSSLMGVPVLPGPGDLLEWREGKTIAARSLADTFTSCPEPAASAAPVAPLHGDALAAAFGVPTRRQAKRNRPPRR